MNAAKEYVAKTQAKTAREESEKRRAEDDRAKVSAVIASKPSENQDEKREN